MVANRLPASLHRMALQFAHGLRKAWWRIARPRVIGVRVIALDEQGRILLVRHAYGSHSWMPPAGGMARGEEPVATACRELREETGCVLTGAKLLGMVEEHLHGACNAVHIVCGTIAEVPCADGREILATHLFDAEALPDDLPDRLRGGLPGWITAAKAARRPDAAAPPAPPAPTG